MRHKESEKSLFPTLPSAEDRYPLLHFISGWCLADSSPNLIRIYPDRLLTGYYVLVRDKDVKEVITWTEGDLQAAGISALGVQQQGQVRTPFCSVGLDFGTTIQVVQLSNAIVGSKATTALEGLAPGSVRLRMGANGVPIKRCNGTTGLKCGGDDSSEGGGPVAGPGGN